MILLELVQIKNEKWHFYVFEKLRYTQSIPNIFKFITWREDQNGQKEWRLFWKYSFQISLIHRNVINGGIIENSWSYTYSYLTLVSIEDG